MKKVLTKGEASSWLQSIGIADVVKATITNELDDNNKQETYAPSELECHQRLLPSPFFNKRLPERPGLRRSQCLESETHETRNRRTQYACNVGANAWDYHNQYKHRRRNSELRAPKVCFETENPAICITSEPNVPIAEPEP